MSTAPKLDYFLAQLAPTAYQQVLSSKATPDERTQLIETLDAIYRAVLQPPLIVKLLDSTLSAADKNKLQKQLMTVQFSTAATERKTRRDVEECEAAKEQLKNEIADLEFELDVARQTTQVPAEEAKDEAEDWEERYLTHPFNLYITQQGWAAVLDLLRESKADTAEKFVSSLFADQHHTPAAVAALRLLQNASFESDWIDPLVDGNPTSDSTKQILQESTQLSRNADMPGYLRAPLATVYRELNMTHVVYSDDDDQWPILVRALKLFHMDYWGGTHLEFMRWLNDEKEPKRRQLLALLSTDRPPDSDTIDGLGLTDTAANYLEELFQVAQHQLRLNTYDFVPVSRRSLLKLLKKVMGPLTKELPALQEKIAQLAKEQSEILALPEAERRVRALELSKGYQEANKQVQALRENLPSNFLTRLASANLAGLMGEAVPEITATDRENLTQVLSKLLEKSEASQPRINWVI